MCGFQMVTYLCGHREKLYEEEFCGLAEQHHMDKPRDMRLRDGKLHCGEIKGWQRFRDYAISPISQVTGLVSLAEPPISNVPELRISSPNSMPCTEDAPSLRAGNN